MVGDCLLGYILDFCPTPAPFFKSIPCLSTQIASSTSVAKGVDGGTLCPLIEAFSPTQVTLGTFKDLLAISQHTVSPRNCNRQYGRLEFHCSLLPPALEYTRLHARSHMFRNRVHPIMAVG